MESDQQLNPLNGVLTEKELCEMFGLKKGQLDKLRTNSQLPFCKINDRVRFYLVKDIYEFIKNKRTILNKG